DSFDAPVQEQTCQYRLGSRSTTATTPFGNMRAASWEEDISRGEASLSSTALADSLTRRRAMYSRGLRACAKPLRRAPRAAIRLGDAEKERTIQRLLRGGTGINKTAATVGVGTATVQRVRAEMGPFESEAAA